MKKAFIAGITGQDGSYLAEYLLELGYEIHDRVAVRGKPAVPYYCVLETTCNTLSATVLCSGWRVGKSFFVRNVTMFFPR